MRQTKPRAWIDRRICCRRRRRQRRRIEENEWMWENWEHAVNFVKLECAFIITHRLLWSNKNEGNKKNKFNIFDRSALFNAKGCVSQCRFSFSHTQRHSLLAKVVCCCCCCFYSTILSSSSYMLFKAFVWGHDQTIEFPNYHTLTLTKKVTFMPEERWKFKVLKHLYSLKPSPILTFLAKNDRCKILQITKSRSFSMQKVFFF